MIPFWALAVLFVLASGAIDRVIGWGEWGRTKPFIVSVLALAGLAYLAGLPPITIGLFPLAYMAWRTPGWDCSFHLSPVFAGTINPLNGRETFGTLTRHMLALVFLIPAYFAHKPLALVAAYMFAFAVIATALAVWNAKKLAHINHTVEFLRGCALGGALVLAFA